MGFAENLKKLREQHGLSQAELAKRIGIAQPTIAQYESGLRVPTVIIAVRMENVLHTTCAELVSSAEKT